MTSLEQAIEHAEQVANSYNDTVPECECAAEHRQLAAWLRELQERREKDNCYGCKHKPFEEKSYCRSCKRICLDKYEPKRRADADD